MIRFKQRVTIIIDYLPEMESSINWVKCIFKAIASGKGLLLWSILAAVVFDMFFKVVHQKEIYNISSCVVNIKEQSILHTPQKMAMFER